MLKSNRRKIILSSIVILLPILFGLVLWNDLPDMLTTHWGADGSVDGFGAKAFAVFGLPSFLLILHLAGLLFTLSDRKQAGQNTKALNLIFWIIPAISLLINGAMYCMALGREFNAVMFLPVLLGLMFLCMGNYLPKVKQNGTLGIKISWTRNNEENWNKTHRFGGKVWVGCGAIMLFSAFLPIRAMLWVMVCVVVAATVAPMLYSHSIYKRHRRAGIVYAAPSKSKAEKTAAKIAVAALIIVLIGTAMLLFTGDIAVHCDETSFRIEASYWLDLELDYSQIEKIEYRRDLDTGMRTNGFGSARLSMGIFQNEEFGAYRLYAYTGAKAFVVLTAEDKTLVIGMKDAAQTQAVYDALLKKIGNV